jgi:predicted transcriptional regulator
VFEGTKELAENKLLILYILGNISHPISNSSLTEIILENNLLNYFHLQQYLGELVDSGFIDFTKEEKRQIYSLSIKGKKVLEYFQNRITDSKKSMVDSYLQSHREAIDKNVDISASYNRSDDGGYVVSCKISENGVCVIDLKLNTESSDNAAKVCSNWNSNASQMYKKIINVLNQ